jgi:uncharacterized membrane protein HdeD (DUF308 family)
MIGALIKNWWAVGIVGGLALILGVMAFATPLSTLASMVLAFGAYALVSGIFHVAAGVTGETAEMGSSRAWIITTGVISIVAGLVTFFWPGLTAVALYTVIAVWAVLAGVAQVVAAIALRKQLQHTWLVALGGIAMAVFGVYLFASPGGILALAYALGTFAIAYGAMMVVAAIQLKQVHDRVEVTLTRAERPAEVHEETWTPR